MVRAALAEAIRTALCAATDANELRPVGGAAPFIERTRDPAKGDFAWAGAHGLAQEAGISPMAVTECLVGHLPPSRLIAAAFPAQGYLNLRVADAWLVESLAAQLVGGGGGASRSRRTEATAEVDIEPLAGPTDAADHARRMAVGGALAAMFALRGPVEVPPGAPAPERIEVVSGPPRPREARAGATQVSCRAVTVRPSDYAHTSLSSVNARYHLLASPTREAIALDLLQAERQVADNPAFMLRHAIARMTGVLRLAASEGHDVSAAALAAGLRPTSPAGPERGLLLSLAEGEDELALATALREPARLARYAERLATEFHAWFAAHRVFGVSPAETVLRLAVVEGTRRMLTAVLADALDLQALTEWDL